jgi:DNA-binding transcriptional LysR family regulator
MLDLIDLRAFARIAQLGSLSAAARALKAPKSSVSRSLSRLEQAVGAVLIERSTRHLRLTDAGTLLRPHAHRILNDVDEAETALGSFGGAPRGLVTVNATYAFTQAVLAPMLPSLLARYPEIQVAFDIESQRVDPLNAEADLVIRLGPLADSALIARRLAVLEIWLCASPAYLATRGTPLSVADLAQHDLIARSGQGLHWEFRTRDGGVETIEVRPARSSRSPRRRSRPYRPAQASAGFRTSSPRPPSPRAGSCAS